MAGITKGNAQVHPARRHRKPGLRYDFCIVNRKTRSYLSNFSIFNKKIRQLSVEFRLLINYSDRTKKYPHKKSNATSYAPVFAAAALTKKKPLSELNKINDQ